MLMHQELSSARAISDFRLFHTGVVQGTAHTGQAVTQVATPRRAKKASTGWRVYLLRCADGTLYAGCTNDLARRLATHNAGKGARYTRSRLPVRVVWSVRVKDRSAALSREAKVKQLTRAQKLQLVRRSGKKGA